MVQKNCEVNHW